MAEELQKGGRLTGSAGQLSPAALPSMDRLASKSGPEGRSMSGQAPPASHSLTGPLLHCSTSLLHSAGPGSALVLVHPPPRLLSFLILKTSADTTSSLSPRAASSHLLGRRDDRLSPSSHPETEMRGSTGRPAMRWDSAHPVLQMFRRGSTAYLSFFHYVRP